MPINTRLKELEDEGNPIRVGVIGAGAFGSMVISQLTYTKGMTPAIVADVKLENALRAFEISGIDHTTIVHAKDVSEADSAIDDKRPVVTSDGCLLVESDVDVVVEATGIVDAGAEYAFRAIMNRKHVVMVNVEADVLVGPFLKKLADNAGVIYSLAYGDQPALVKELYDWADMLGFDIVAGGKGARYRADFRKGTPDDALIRYGFSSDKIESVDLNPKMYNSFLDGTKSAVEMASVSNMTGLIPDVRGMHIPASDLRNIPKVLSLKRWWHS